MAARWRIQTLDKRHMGHDLPSFRPPEGKPYMLLVWSFIDDDVQRCREGFGGEISFVCRHGYFFERFWGSKRVGDFVEAAVALVRFGEASFDCDDSCRSWHLELEICIVWNRHELCECRSPEYGVILRLPVEYFELECLLCEVEFPVEDHIKLYCSDGGCCFARDYAVYCGS